MVGPFPRGPVAGALHRDIRFEEASWQWSGVCSALRGPPVTILVMALAFHWPSVIGLFHIPILPLPLALNVPNRPKALAGYRFSPKAR